MRRLHITLRRRCGVTAFGILVVFDFQCDVPRLPIFLAKHCKANSRQNLTAALNYIEDDLQTYTWGMTATTNSSKDEQVYNCRIATAG